jgi:hypothetical protein
MRGLKGVPPRLFYDTFASASGTPWAVVFYSGDGIYDLHVVRKDGWATRLRCALNAR